MNTPNLKLVIDLMSFLGQAAERVEAAFKTRIDYRQEKQTYKAVIADAGPAITRRLAALKYRRALSRRWLAWATRTAVGSGVEVQGKVTPQTKRRSFAGGGGRIWLPASGMPIIGSAVLDKTGARNAGWFQF